MAKKTRRDNHHLKVYPDTWLRSNPTHADYKMILEEIEKATKRHVDNVRVTSIEWDTTEYCGFCGCEWSAAINEGGLPECCDQAYDEAKREKTSKEQMCHSQPDKNSGS